MSIHPKKSSSSLFDPLPSNIVTEFYLGNYIFKKHEVINRCLCGKWHELQVPKANLKGTNLLDLQNLFGGSLLHIFTGVRGLIEYGRVEWVKILIQTLEKGREEILLNEENINIINVNEAILNAIEQDKIELIELGEYNIEVIQGYTHIDENYVIYSGYMSFWNSGKLCLSETNKEYYSVELQINVIVKILQKKYIKFERMENIIYYSEIPSGLGDSIFGNEVDLLATLVMLESKGILKICDIVVGKTLGETYIKLEINQIFLEMYIQNTENSMLDSTNPDKLVNISREIQYSPQKKILIYNDKNFNLSETKQGHFVHDIIIAFMKQKTCTYDKFTNLKKSYTTQTINSDLLTQQYNSIKKPSSKLNFMFDSIRIQKGEGYYIK